MDFPPDPPPPKSFRSLFFGQKPPTPSQKQTTVLLEPGLKALTHHVEPAPSHLTNLHLNPSHTLFKSNILISPSSSSTKKFDPVMENEKHHDPVEREGKGLNREVEEREQGEKEEEIEEDDDGEEYDCGVYPLDRKVRDGRQLPPPIPSLARTGNLPCHMPWVLKRSYQNDGRLVIQEFKVRRHEFFRAHRANGRLTLQLVQLGQRKLQQRPDPNGPIQEESRIDEEETQLLQHFELSSSSSDKENQHEPKLDHLESHALAPSSSLMDELEATHDHDHVSSSPPSSSSSSVSGSTMLSSSLPESSFGGIAGMGGGNSGACFAPMRSNSLFQMPIPTIRPVHS